MKAFNKWTVLAVGLVAGTAGVGVGTVAAQQAEEEPWWHATSLALSADVVTMNGDVAVHESGLIASGSVRKAKTNFPETGEYIGCSVRGFPDNGQFLICVARDAQGEEFHCESEYGVGGQDLTIKMQTMLMPAMNINADSYVLMVGSSNGECETIEVTNSSADFFQSRRRDPN